MNNKRPKPKPSVNKPDVWERNTYNVDPAQATTTPYI